MYGKNTKLRELVNLVVTAGNIFCNIDVSNSTKTREEISGIYIEDAWIYIGT